MQYLSGFQALNIPNQKGLIADWHPQIYLNPKKILFYESDNNPLKDLGIRKCFVKTLQKEYNVASFARAIADLLYFNKTAQMQGIVDDFLDEDDAMELFNYLKILPKTQIVQRFLKYELTKLYFKEKNGKLSDRASEIY
ncbi:hypothetical protein [Campylobacter sp. US33a]|uniref:hypothetical protein n=1 Tax=Campylobacter sp. US33a TaxID=2498120 RepID=UPI001067F06D|nr:hypothetical protein [Campylobacter sp. US33a]TEY00739.1 hypothetical protein ELQ16_08880 [Campylobacter sp. US33a]